MGFDVVVTLVGILACYRANGGRDGEPFLQMYFPLAWVMGWRIWCLGLVVIPLVGLLWILGISLLGQLSVVQSVAWNVWTIVLQVVLSSLLSVFYYVRLVAHIQHGRECSPGSVVPTAQ